MSLRTKLTATMKYLLSLKGNDTCSRETTLLKLFWFLSGKVSALKGKNLLPLGANSFLVEQTPFQKGLDVKKRKQEVTKVLSLIKWQNNLCNVSRPLKKSLV